MSSKTIVLIVSYFFAPGSQVGAKRFSFLAPELERLGFDVRVIAGKSADGETEDPSLPVVSQVHRSSPTLTLPLRGRFWGRAANRMARKLLAPVGFEVFWNGPAVRAVGSLDLQGKRGVVIGTVPPHSTAIAATRIARNLDWPLILDYRDPWTAYPSVRTARGGWQRSGWSYAIATRLERGCIERSRARVLNTDEMKVLFEEHFPQADPQWNFVIPNGLGFPADDSETAPAAIRGIVHAGAMYGDRSFLPVLRALSTIVRADPTLKDVRLVQYGELLPEDRQAIEAEQLQQLLVEKPRVSRDCLWPILRAARVLLVVSGREMTYSIPYKVYDYLAAGRPILALAPARSAVARMFTECRIGSFVDPRDVSGLHAALSSLLKGETHVSDTQVLQRHLWSKLAMDYRQVIDAVLNDGTAP